MYKFCESLKDGAETVLKSVGDQGGATEGKNNASLEDFPRRTEYISKDYDSIAALQLSSCHRKGGVLEYTSLQSRPRRPHLFIRHNLYCAIR